MEFNLMRNISHRSARRYAWYSVAMWILLWGLLWIGGSTIFWITEKPQWTYFEALYFAFAALVVVGYGDLTFHHDASKPFFVLWSLFAVPTITTLITTFAGAFGSTYLAEKGWTEVVTKFISRLRGLEMPECPTHGLAGNTHAQPL
jgi:potassium channel subfamily K